jgi:death-on-curing protein
VTVLSLDLTDYLAIAAEVTGIDSKTLARITKLEMADSALHAPDAGWGDDDLYPDFVDKAAVLIFSPHQQPPPPRWQQTRRLGVASCLYRAQSMGVERIPVN